MLPPGHFRGKKLFRQQRFIMKLVTAGLAYTTTTTMVIIIIIIVII